MRALQPGETDMWDPQQYARFADERARPFHDLLGQVPLREVHNAVDLGCGPGKLTHTLAERWPTATVVGVDNSPEMLEQAQKHARPGRVRFEAGDLATWQPPGPLDLIVCNAALHWVADHARVLASWAGMLARDGALAVQMPYRFRSRFQQTLDAVVQAPRWAASLR